MTENGLRIESALLDVALVLGLTALSVLILYIIVLLFKGIWKEIKDQ